MKSTKCMLGILIAIIISLAMVGCSAIATTKITPVPAEIEITDNIIVAMGEEFQLETIIKSDVDLGLVEMPETKTVAGKTVEAIYDIKEFKYSIKFVSADETIVTVNENGLITTISVGETTITVTAGEISKDITVSVKEYYIPEGMPIAVEVLLNSSFNIFEDIGDNQIVKATFSIEDESIATIDNDGTIHALKQGVTRLTTTVGEYTFPTAIAVLVPIEDINVTDKVVEIGKTAKADIILVPEEADFGTLFTYKSSDESVATVDENGIVKGIKAGTATITVYTDNGIEKSFNVTVKSAAAPVTSNAANIYPEDFFSPEYQQSHYEGFEILIPGPGYSGAIGSGGGSSSSGSYYPEGTPLYGMTEAEIRAAYPEPAYGTVSFENENAKPPYYWQHATISYEQTADGWTQNIIFGGGTNQSEFMKYAEPAFPWPSDGEGPKSATIWVYLGDGLA